MYDYRYTDSALSTYSLLRRARMAIDKVLEVELAKVDLSPEQLSVLWTCRDDNGTMNVTELAFRFFRSKASVAELLKRMEKQGLIERLPKRPGHPYVEVLLTPKGEEACVRGTGIVKVIFTDLMEVLSEQQRKELQSLMKPLLDKALEFLEIETIPLPGRDIGESVRVNW